MIRNSVRDNQGEASLVDRRLLVRYRVMAFTTATLLIILVFVGIPLQLAAGRPQVVNDVGTIHGILYLVYLYVAFELTRRLGIPKWQMGLVLLAGTVPFAAFVAERKMTKRFEAMAPEPSAGKRVGGSRTTWGPRMRKRWFSRRALLLHLEVAIIAPGCVAAGWWQATRALAGNGLSWVYSVEWPVFALLAIAGWWQLIHEDPEAYRARKQAPRRSEQDATAGGSAARPASTLGRDEEVAVERGTVRLATTVAVLIGVEFALGIVAMLSLSVGRPSGWLPARGEAVYLAHAILGLPVTIGAAALLVRVRGSTRAYQMVGWIAFIGMALAGVGGLLTSAQSLVRFLGIALMFAGPMLAGLGYLVPALDRLPRKASPVVSTPSPRPPDVQLL
ncbi:MAG: DUF3817 domain-containing protein [Acidimicrobiales bacterium]|jgi:integral membrane protein